MRQSMPCRKKILSEQQEQRAKNRGTYEFVKMHDSYASWSARQENQDRKDLLVMDALMAVLASPVFCTYMQILTGTQGLSLDVVRATRYRAGHFLTRHADHIPKQGKIRTAAFVLNLSENWEADWGGLLIFENEHRHATEVMHPLWNSLSVFRVPQIHSVSQVAAWAKTNRLALSGWVLK